MNKLALITGGSGYIGEAIMQRFRERGYMPVSLSRQEGIDITDEASVEKAVKTAVAEYGQVYACVHAAASRFERKLLLSITPDSFDAELLVAARGAYLLARSTKPHLAKEAAFIGITTEAVEHDEPVSLTGAYVPAKYALRGVLRMLAAELPRVYAVAPGFLPGGLNSDIPLAAREMLAKKYESPTVQEIAALVVELCEGSPISSGMSVKADRSYTPL
jgi:NAD(P)-dependent dehydrogenase (short-subunit alcohol dehydrogenase family)